jgi:Mn-dependent DtxR family transcriptional regulator
VQILVQTTQTITERKRQILETVMILISAEPSMTLQDLAKQMGVSLRSVKEYVDALQKANLLVREGSKKVGSWHINEDIN